MSKQLDVMKEVLKKRHSEYNITNEWVAPKSDVEQLLGDVLQLVPSFYNAQNVRMVLLTDDAHLKHWDIIEEVLIDKIGKERYEEGTKDKIHGSFRSGVGTVLFFEETKTVKELQAKMPTYADNFTQWSTEVQGSHQFAVWVGLTALGFGASLQHYNGMEDDKVRAQVDAPDSWRFIGHMPFGKVVTPAEAKEKLPLSETLKVFS